eukprot:2225167-Karenia_brevis.AAC.1
MHCRSEHRDFGRQQHALDANAAGIGICDDCAQKPRTYNTQNLPQPDWHLWFRHAVYIDD